MEIIARGHDNLNPLMLFVFLVSIDLYVLIPVNAVHAAIWIVSYTLELRSRCFGRGRKLIPVRTLALMKIQDRFVFFSVSNAENSDQVLDIRMAVFALPRMVAFDTKRQAKTNLVQIEPLVIVVIVLLCDLHYVRVMLAKQMNRLDRCVNEHDD